MENAALEHSGTDVTPSTLLLKDSQNYLNLSPFSRSAELLKEPQHSFANLETRHSHTENCGF